MNLQVLDLCYSHLPGRVGESSVEPQGSGNVIRASGELWDSELSMSTVGALCKCTFWNFQNNSAFTSFSFSVKVSLKMYK
jgi:hypothetical protein